MGSGVVMAVVEAGESCASLVAVAHAEPVPDHPRPSGRRQRTRGDTPTKHRHASEQRCHTGQLSRTGSRAGLSVRRAKYRAKIANDVSD